MQILIGSAKIMTDNVQPGIPFVTKPAFIDIARDLANELATYSPEELQCMLHVSKPIADENWRRYHRFQFAQSGVPAAFAYDGMVFRKLAPETMSTEDLRFANRHLFIGSFLYGLLRPLDRINPYRLEGNVELPYTGNQPLFQFWRPILTDYFIHAIQADDGILVNLASNEFKGIFDWKRVEKELTVVTPEFKVAKHGKPRTVVIYAKMCRGAMTRWIIQNRLSQTEDLRCFEYEGFQYESDWNFILR